MLPEIEILTAMKAQLAMPEAWCQRRYYVESASGIERRCLFTALSMTADDVLPFACRPNYIRSEAGQCVLTKLVERIKVSHTDLLSKSLIPQAAPSEEWILCWFNNWTDHAGLLALIEETIASFGPVPDYSIDHPPYRGQWIDSEIDITPRRSRVAFFGG